MALDGGLALSGNVRPLVGKIKINPYLSVYSTEQQNDKNKIIKTTRTRNQSDRKKRNQSDKNKRTKTTGTEE